MMNLSGTATANNSCLLDKILCPPNCQKHANGQPKICRYNARQRLVCGVF